MRTWFNKTFSTISAVFRDIRQSISAGEATLIYTHTYITASAFWAVDKSHLEPAGLA
jgi:hypothetical protein